MKAEAEDSHRSRGSFDFSLSLALLHETDAVSQCGAFFLVEDVGRHGECLSFGRKVEGEFCLM